MGSEPWHRGYGIYNQVWACNSQSEFDPLSQPGLMAPECRATLCCSSWVLKTKPNIIFPQNFSPRYYLHTIIFLINLEIKTLFCRLWRHWAASYLHACTQAHSVTSGNLTIIFSQEENENAISLNYLKTNFTPKSWPLLTVLASCAIVS